MTQAFPLPINSSATCLNICYQCENTPLSILYYSTVMDVSNHDIGPSDAVVKVDEQDRVPTEGVHHLAKHAGNHLEIIWLLWNDNSKHLTEQVGNGKSPLNKMIFVFLSSAIIIITSGYK